MIRLRPLSIRDKLVGSILLTTTLCLSGGFAFVIAIDIRGFKREMVDSTVFMARVVGDHTVAALAFGDRTEAEKVLRTLEGVPNVEVARLYDTRGEVFATFIRTPTGRFPPLPPGAYHEFHEGLLHVFEPVVGQGERYGAIHLAASTRPLGEKVRRHLWVMLGALTALILLSVPLAVALQRALSEPILRLADTARWVSRTHDYGVRVAKTSEDELGVLCDGFNEMLGELGRKTEELKEKGAMLETLYRQEREVTHTLQALNEMKTNFLVVTSHEMRTPVTVIRGYLEALLGGVVGRLSDAQRDALAACQRMVYRMVEAIANIQQMLEVNEGFVVAKPAAVDLRATAREMLEELAPFIDQRRQRVVLHAPEAVHVTGDQDKLEFVLVHLIQNAIKFTPDGGEIRVVLTADPEDAHLTVQDTGVGIDPREIERIFERFYTTVDHIHHKSGRYQFEARGSGLGLAIARSYVEAHGGRMWAESEGRGQGSRFHVVLPVAGAVRKPPAHAPSS